MRTIYVAAALILAACLPASAATTTITVVINSPPSTSITCTPIATLTAPVAANATVCPITVLPNGWSGSLALSGTNAGLFSIASGSGSPSLVVGSAGISAAGSYSVTITASP